MSDHGIAAGARLMQPKVEAEVAFVIGRSPSSVAPRRGEFIAAIDCALPAVEIVDSAIADWKIVRVDPVADNASSALYLLGHQPVAIGALADAELGMQMSIDGRVVSVGGGAACLGHPLHAGELGLSGALGPIAPVVAGDRIQARSGGLDGCGCRCE